MGNNYNLDKVLTIMNSTAEKSLNIKRKQRRIWDIILYSSASLSIALPYQFFGARYIHFYTEELRVPTYMVTIVLVIYGIWNAVNDPLLGWLSDRTNTRLGKRFPYILFGFLPFSLSFIAVWLPSASWIGNDWLLFVYMLVTFFLFDGLFTLVTINWVALFPEKYKSVKERNNVSALRQLFSIIGLVGAFILPPMIIGEYGDFAGYRTVAYILGGVTAVNLGLSLFACKDPKIDEEKEKKKYSLKEAFKTALKSKNFVGFMIGNMCLNLAFITMMGIIPFFNQYVLKQEMANETIINAAAIGSAVIFAFVWAQVSIRKGAKFVFLLSALFFVVGLIPLYFVTDMTFVIIILIIIGVGIGGMLMIPDILISDVIDEDAAKFGKRRPGLFFGFNGFVIRIAIVIQGGTFGLVTTLTGFDADLNVQSDTAVIGLKILLVVVPIIALILGGVGIYFLYNLNKKKVAEIKEELKIKGVDNSPP